MPSPLEWKVGDGSNFSLPHCVLTSPCGCHILFCKLTLPFSHLKVESIYSSVQSGPVLAIGLTNRMRRKWHVETSDLRP